MTFTTAIFNQQITENFWFWEAFQEHEKAAFLRLPFPRQLELYGNICTVFGMIQRHVRDKYKRRVTVTDLWRIKTSGDGTSFHHDAKAIDFVVEGMSTKEVAKDLDWWPGGMGLYNAHIHLDIRDLWAIPKHLERARWIGVSR